MNRRKGISLRFLISLYIAKLLQKITKIIYKDKGTQFPGRVATKICPDFLSRIGRPNKVIAITGTNGKTSVSNFLNTILRQSGITTINNSKGSNTLSGVASALIEVCDILGRVKEEVAIFEIDERIGRFIYDHITPTYLLCTNLFRDSIKRNGHAEFILTKIKSSVPKSTILILNADDLISINIGNENHKKYFFAVNKLDNNKPFKNIVSDIVVCPYCKDKLRFRYRHYHHIGRAYCLNCDFKAPNPHFKVLSVDKNKKILTLIEGKKKHIYNLVSDSIFNIYNIVSAIAVARVLGLPHDQIKLAFEDIKLKKDRIDSEFIRNIEVITMLSKNQNPISCSRVFEYVSRQPGNKVILLYITDSLDKSHGSEDISWLYDVDFEYFKTNDIKQIVIAGTRMYDVVLRLKLAGINESKITGFNHYDNIESLLNLSNIDKIYILYELYAYPLVNKLKNKIQEKVSNND